jgi:hypothetical protein
MSSSARSQQVFSRVWHGVLAVMVLVALVAQTVLIVRNGHDVNATSGNGGPVATRLVNLFSYFTIQSNILVIVVAGSLALRPDRDGRLWRVVRLDMLLGIVITGAVFGILLAGLVHQTGIEVWINAAFHYVAPWWALAGWLLFGPRPRIDRRTVGWIFVWPVAWIVYTFVRGGLTGFYPYPFLDADELGLPVALRNTAGVLVVAGVLALLLRFFDRRLRTLEV